MALLVTACHGKAARHDEAKHVGSGSAARPTSVVSEVVPHLPPSPDPMELVAGIDLHVEQLRKEPRANALFVATLLERAGVSGNLEDYQEALDRTKAWTDKDPKDPAAWGARVTALTRVHQFTDARAALVKLKPLDKEQTAGKLEVSIDEATGHLDRVLPVRAATAHDFPSTIHYVEDAAALTLAGKADEALGLMPKAVAVVNDNGPVLFNWLLFTWGRIYELKGELAAARQFFAEAHTRLPTLESTVHLAQTMMATGDRAGAKQLVEAELAKHRHPELLGLAVGLDHPELADEARAAWERYLKALPLAFSDHAARYYLAAGKDPARALVLAKQNLANRDTHEAHALVVEAALAANDPKTACDAAAPLASPEALRPERFTAWKALSACGRKPEADRLAHDLGITH
ncbi:MAG TPA: hypothetical protein VGF94_05965 [Kofleriaceae bacterium]